VYRSNATNQKWVRIKSSVRFSKDSASPQLFFEHGIDQANDKIYFAFTYPYTYTMLQNELEEVEAQHVNDLADKESIFYQRELITRSLDGRRVDLITISSPDGASENEREPLLSGLFPETKRVGDRPPVFREKEVVFVSARVHPGEVPAQHTFKGIFNLLMDPNDLRAKELRARYVFKLMPMLNPDGVLLAFGYCWFVCCRFLRLICCTGVYRGHFRMDQLGQNLNRYYINSDAMLQPSVFAAKSLTDYYAAQNKLSVYLDFHAHASKRGCFIYGNVLDSAEDQIQNQLYCKLIALNSAHFDYEGCLFSKDHMTRIDPGDQAKGLTAEGSGRVSMYLAHGIIHSYTIECNYNTSRVGNEIALSDCEPGGAADNPASPFTTNPEKYTPATFAGVGRACVIALLDIRGHNPCSRLPKSKFKTLDRVRNAVMMEVRSRKEYIGKAVNRERRRSMAALERKGNDVAVSVDDLCWRRVVEIAATETPVLSASAAPSPVPGAHAQSAKDAPSAKPGDVFFVSMKDGKAPRRRQRSASAVQVPVSTIQLSSGGSAGFGPAFRSNIASTDNSSAGSSRSDTPLRDIFTSVPPKATGPSAPVTPVPSRPSLRTEANSTYVPTNALLPHLHRKANADVVRAVDLLHRDASTGKISANASQQDLCVLPDARPSPQSPPDLKLQATPLTLPHHPKRSEQPSSSAMSVAGTMASNSAKSGRNILGKKLHAAGIALVLGNNSHSFTSLEAAQNEASTDPVMRSQGDALDALSSKTGQLRLEAPQRPASSGGVLPARHRVAPQQPGIAIQDDFAYTLSPAATRDPYATSPVKSIRSPLGSPATAAAADTVF
jgi:hypothetical protein